MPATFAHERLRAADLVMSEEDRPSLPPIAEHHRSHVDTHWSYCQCPLCTAERSRRARQTEAHQS